MKVFSRLIANVWCIFLVFIVSGGEFFSKQFSSLLNRNERENFPIHQRQTKRKDIRADTSMTLTRHHRSSQSTTMTIQKRKSTRFPCDKAQQRAMTIWKLSTPTQRTFIEKCLTKLEWKIDITKTLSSKFVSFKSNNRVEWSAMNIWWCYLPLNDLNGLCAFADTTRVRQQRKDKTNRLNQSQSIDLNNDDLNGHDFIDSIMFIYYYGKNVKSWKDLGGNIVIIGAGFSIFAQILTVILVSLRNRRMRKNNAFFPITMNLLVMLFLSNLLFIVGVQSNKNAIRCEMIALLLHYLYLTTSVWCFVFIFIIYDLIINESLRLKMRFILLMAYAGPAIYVMVNRLNLF